MVGLKKLIAYIASYLLFWMGHFTSVLMRYKIFGAGRLYSIYYWFMVTSGNIQDWAGNNKPWEKFD